MKDPTSVIIHSGNAEKEGEFIFIVDRAGEYTFCFSNAMSTFAEKTVNFEIMLSSEAKSNARRKAATGENAIEESAAPLEESLGKVREGLLKIERSVRYYKTREKVHFTCQATHGRRPFLWFANRLMNPWTWTTERPIAKL